MEILSKLNAPMRAVGSVVLKPLGFIIEKAQASATSNVFTAEAVEGAIATDASEEQSSVSGAWANMVVLYVGWAAVLFSIFGAVLCGAFKKKPMRRRRRKATTRRRTTRRTYKRKK